MFHRIGFSLTPTPKVQRGQTGQNCSIPCGGAPRQLLPVFLVGLTLLTGCAQITPPGGGPIDQTPPTIIQVLPPCNSAVPTQIRLRFSEPIQIRPAHPPFFTPALPYSLTIFRKEMFLTLHSDTLAGHRRPSFLMLTLKGSVVDATEGNPLPFWTCLWADSSVVLETLFVQIRPFPRSGSMASSRKRTPDVFLQLVDSLDSLVFLLPSTSISEPQIIVAPRQTRQTPFAWIDRIPNQRYDPSEPAGIPCTPSDTLFIPVAEIPRWQIQIMHHIIFPATKQDQTILFHQIAGWVSIPPAWQLKAFLPVLSVDTLTLLRFGDTLYFWIHTSELAQVVDSLVLRIRGHTQPNTRIHNPSRFSDTTFTWTIPLPKPDTVHNLCTSWWSAPPHSSTYALCQTCFPDTFWLHYADSVPQILIRTAWTLPSSCLYRAESLSSPSHSGQTTLVVASASSGPLSPTACAALFVHVTAKDAPWWYTLRCGRMVFRGAIATTTDTTLHFPCIPAGTCTWEAGIDWYGDGGYSRPSFTRCGEPPPVRRTFRVFPGWIHHERIALSTTPQPPAQ